jgi:hypothetical protein
MDRRQATPAFAAPAAHAATRRNPRKPKPSRRAVPSPEVQRPNKKPRTTPSVAVTTAPSRLALDEVLQETFSNSEEDEVDVILPEGAGAKLAGTSKGKNKGKPGRRKQLRVVEDESSDEEPRLVLRMGSLDQTSEDMLIVYTITWACKVAGKKVAEDSIRNVKDCLEIAWTDFLYNQRERRLEQNGAPKNRKFRVCKITVKSPNKGGALPFTVDNDSPTSSAQWREADDHLADLGNKYAGRELVVKIE